MLRSITLLKDFHPFTAGESFNLKPLTILVGDQGAGKSTLIDLMVKYERPKLAEVNNRYKIESGSLKFTGKRGDYNAQNESTQEQLISIESTNETPTFCYVDTEKHNPRMTRGETTLEYKDAIIETLRDDTLHKIIQTLDGYKNDGYRLESEDSHMEIDALTNRLLENLGKHFDSKRGGTILGDELKMDMTTAAIATMQSHGQSIFPLIENSTRGVENSVILLDEPETALSVRSQHKIAAIIKKLAEHNQVILATHSPIIMGLSDEVLSLEHRKWMSTTEFLKSQEN